MRSLNLAKRPLVLPTRCPVGGEVLWNLEYYHCPEYVRYEQFEGGVTRFAFGTPPHLIPSDEGVLSPGPVVANVLGSENQKGRDRIDCKRAVCRG